MPTIWLGRYGANARITSGCSKRLSSKAAASEAARRTLRYVESLSDARTPLADFFSILLEPVRGQRRPSSLADMEGSSIPFENGYDQVTLVSLCAGCSPHRNLAGRKIVHCSFY